MKKMAIFSSVRISIIVGIFAILWIGFLPPIVQGNIERIQGEVENAQQKVDSTGHSDYLEEIGLKYSSRWAWAVYYETDLAIAELDLTFANFDLFLWAVFLIAMSILFWVFVECGFILIKRLKEWF